MSFPTRFHIRSFNVLLNEDRYRGPKWQQHLARIVPNVSIYVVDIPIEPSVELRKLAFQMFRALRKVLRPFLYPFLNVHELDNRPIYKRLETPDCAALKNFTLQRVQEFVDTTRPV